MDIDIATLPKRVFVEDYQSLLKELRTYETVLCNMPATTGTESMGNSFFNVWVGLTDILSRLGNNFKTNVTKFYLDLKRSELRYYSEMHARQVASVEALSIDQVLNVELPAPSGMLGSYKEATESIQSVYNALNADTVLNNANQCFNNIYRSVSIEDGKHRAFLAQFVNFSKEYAGKVKMAIDAMNKHFTVDRTGNEPFSKSYKSMEEFRQVRHLLIGMEGHLQAIARLEKNHDAIIHSVENLTTVFQKDTTIIDKPFLQDLSEMVRMTATVFETYGIAAQRQCALEHNHVEAIRALYLDVVTNLKPSTEGVVTDTVQNEDWKWTVPISDSSAISQFEKFCNKRLPADFIACVKQNNNGHPVKKTIKLQNDVNEFHFLYSFNTNKSWNIFKAFTCMQKNGDANLVPFADTPNGDDFCFRYEGNSVKDVVMWYHETGKVEHLASSFSALLQKLEKDSAQYGKAASTEGIADNIIMGLGITAVVGFFAVIFGLIGTLIYQCAARWRRIKARIKFVDKQSFKQIKTTLPDMDRIDHISDQLTEAIEIICDSLIFDDYQPNRATIAFNIVDFQHALHVIGCEIDPHTYKFVDYRNVFEMEQSTCGARDITPYAWGSLMEDWSHQTSSMDLLKSLEAKVANIKNLKLHLDTNITKSRVLVQTEYDREEQRYKTRNIHFDDVIDMSEAQARILLTSIGMAAHKVATTIKTLIEEILRIETQVQYTDGRGPGVEGLFGWGRPKSTPAPKAKPAAKDYTKEQIDTLVKKIISEQLGVNVTKVTDSANIKTGLGVDVDSLDAIEIVMALEEEFGFDIPDKDAESVVTVSAVVAYIAKRLKEENSSK